jgi:hypothetical protein
MHLQQTKRGSIATGGAQYYFHDLSQASRPEPPPDGSWIVGEPYLTRITEEPVIRPECGPDLPAEVIGTLGRLVACRSEFVTA